ncbi:hypothetical protein [Synechococcus sp. CB0205]|uniref:hypothetical protein n=1 Tax=Synechococcus sp. CB0205 TaxID=232363 RepID=UPI0002002F99|nr:hypothetical protein [Synechococcus sp. CB0205]
MLTLEPQPQPHRKAGPARTEPLGSCDLFMPVVFRGAAIGGVIALVMQACGPTPLGAVVRGALVQPMHARQSVAAELVQSKANSLPHLPIPACQDAACAGR